MHCVVETTSLNDILCLTCSASKEESEKMAKMEEEGLNCDKLCSGGDTETAPPAQVSGKKKFVAKKKTT